MIIIIGRGPFGQSVEPIEMFDCFTKTWSSRDVRGKLSIGIDFFEKKKSLFEKICFVP